MPCKLLWQKKQTPKTKPNRNSVPLICFCIYICLEYINCSSQVMYSYLVTSLEPRLFRFNGDYGIMRNLICTELSDFPGFSMTRDICLVLSKCI